VDQSTTTLTYDEAVAKALEYVHAAVAHVSAAPPDNR
jgi:hypothetical protein